MTTQVVRRTGAGLLTAALVAVLLAGCGDDGDAGSSAADSQAPATSETSAVFDPAEHGVGDDEDDNGDDTSPTTVTPEGPDPSDCPPDPDETNAASMVRDYLDCAAPDLGEVVTSATAVADHIEVGGDIDPADAVEICVLVSGFVYSDEVDGPDSVRAVEVHGESGPNGEDGELLAVRESPDDECEAA